MKVTNPKIIAAIVCLTVGVAGAIIIWVITAMSDNEKAKVVQTVGDSLIGWGFEPPPGQDLHNPDNFTFNEDYSEGGVSVKMTGSNSGPVHFRRTTEGLEWGCFGENGVFTNLLASEPGAGAVFKVTRGCLPYRGE